MATLQGQPIKNTYPGLLKTEANTTVTSNPQIITDGQGNTTALALSDSQLYVSGTLNLNPPSTDATWYLSDGATVDGQYYQYNSTSSAIYLNAWLGDYDVYISASLVDQFPPGKTVYFNHTILGVLSGSVLSSSFYDGGAYAEATIIYLTSDPSNGVDDKYPPTSTTGKYPFMVWADYDSSPRVALGTDNTVVALAHAEGWYNTAAQPFSHAEGYLTKALGTNSHAEGYITTAWGLLSHAEGQQTLAKGTVSHAEGMLTTANAGAHSEGQATKALGSNSHAEGGYTEAIGDYSHAEGSRTTAVGQYSHAEGLGTISSGSAGSSFDGVPQHAEGRFNIPDTTSLLIVGNGTYINGFTTRANAFAIATFGTNNAGSTAVLPYVSASLNLADDSAAASAGVPVGGLYHTSGTVKIRLT